MRTAGKVFIGLGVLGGVGVGGYFYLKNRAKELEIVPLPNIHSFDLKDGLKITVGAKFKNPTGMTINILQPFIRVYLGEKEIGSSKPSKAVIEIPEYTEKALEKPIELSFPLLNLAAIIPTIYELIVDKDFKKPKVRIEVKTPVKVPLGIYFPVWNEIELSI